MRKFECGSLIIGHHEPEGLLTDRDIVIFGLAEGLDPDETTVSDIMTSHLITCDEEDTVEMAATKMSTHDVRRLVVLNPIGEVVGLLSVADIIKRADSDQVNDEVVHQLFKYA
jgi:CBS domain-containing protein